MRLMRLIPLLIALLVPPAMASGQQEGISVHGYWKLAVFDPDGTLVHEVAFENALVGYTFLPEILGGGYTMGATYVTVGNSAGTGPCNATDCKITTSGHDIDGTADSTNLVLNGMSTHHTLDTLRLRGSVNADVDTTVNFVTTRTTHCGNFSTPPACKAAHQFDNEFTRATITPVSVNAGQSIQVEVNLVFQ